MIPGGLFPRFLTDKYDPSADLYYGNVTHLFRADGTESSTSFLNAKSGASVTATNVVNAAASARFGARGASFSAGGIIPLGTITIPTAFTFEMWLKPSGAPTACGIMGPSAGNLIMGYRSSTQFGVGVQGGFIVYGNGVPTSGVWNHVVIQRDSSFNVSVFVNGSRTAFGQMTNTFTTASAYRIQSDAALSMDEMRFTPGVARYSGVSCPVPSKQYPTV